MSAERTTSELPEPVFSEAFEGFTWITLATFANGNVYRITQSEAGAFVGEFEINGPRFHADGFQSVDAAIAYLQDWS